MKRWLFWGALGVLVLAYPLLTADSAVYQRLGALVLLAAIGASAWNIVGGYAGQVSVGHAVYFGIGAYVPLLAYELFQAPPLLGLPFGIVIAVLIALLIGLPTFRLQGHYFSMATIAVAELIRLVVGNWDLLGAAI